MGQPFLAPTPSHHDVSPLCTYLRIKRFISQSNLLDNGLILVSRECPPPVLVKKAQCR